MSATAEAKGRLGLLDPLRGVLAILVAVYHLSVWFQLTDAGTGLNMALARLGNYGVSAFFVLSGFVLFRTTPWVRVQQEGVLRFWKRRFLRLAPIFYLACTLNLIFRLGMGPEPTFVRVLENLTFTFGAIHPNHALVTGGWYVGLVALLYFAYPALAWLEAKAGPRALVVLALGLTVWSLPPTLHGVMAVEPWNHFHQYVLAPNQLFLLSWGALLAALHAGTSRRLQPWVIALVALPLLWILVRPAPQFYDHLVALTGWIRYRYLLVVTALVALAAFAEHRDLGRVGHILTRLGEWSFGLYLLHPFAKALVMPHLPGRAGFAVALILSFLAAALAHRWIEEPVARLARR